jgi:hypothetical protein
MDVESLYSGQEAEDSESAFGFNVGAGLDVASNPTIAWGMGVGFHSILTERNMTNTFIATLSLLFGVEI